MVAPPSAAGGWPRTRPTTRPGALRDWAREEPGQPRASPPSRSPSCTARPTPSTRTTASSTPSTTWCSEGVLGGYGVSVETVAQGLWAIERPGVATVQVILNAFRLKPVEQLLPGLRRGRRRCDRPRPAGLRAAVGALRREHDLPPQRPPHLQPRGRGLRHRRDLLGRALRRWPGGRPAPGQTAVPEGWTLPEVALRWCADAPGDSTVIPGARSPEQAAANAAAGKRPPLPDRRGRPWRGLPRRSAPLVTRW